MNERDQSSDVLVSELADDEDLIELVETFVEELPLRASSIAKALAEADFAALQMLAHQLKGAAGGYGFPTISAAAQALEATCMADRNLEKLTAQAQQMLAVCLKARARKGRDIATDAGEKKENTHC